jgi:hypothetical protein
MIDTDQEGFEGLLCMGSVWGEADKESDSRRRDTGFN